MNRWIVVFMIPVLLAGCVWIDDDDGCCDEYREHIIYINRTGCRVRNSIDGRVVGSVPAWGTMHEYGDDYDGYHTFFSEGENCNLEWGPTEFYLHEGETFRIYLEDGDMRTSGSGPGDASKRIDRSLNPDVL